MINLYIAVITATYSANFPLKFSIYQPEGITSDLVYARVYLARPRGFSGVTHHDMSIAESI